MILLVSGATKTVRELNRPDRIGHLLVPGGGNAVPKDACWAADNQAFTGLDPAKFCRMLSRIAGKPNCLWVACPDVVGDSHATWGLYAHWGPVIRSMGLPVAFVAQDGSERFGVPLNGVDCIFIGGSTEWKMGPHAARVVRYAKQHGKLVHFGRTNTRQRFRYAFEIGCDSCDGLGFSRFPSRIGMALRWLEELERQPSLLAA